MRDTGQTGVTPHPFFRKRHNWRVCLRRTEVGNEFAHPLVLTKENTGRLIVTYLTGARGYAQSVARNHARSALGGDFDGGLRAYPAEGGADVFC
jgi:hypothetical protein